MSVWRDALEARRLSGRRSQDMNEERLKYALEASVDALWDWHMQGGESATYLSPRYYTMLGYEPGEFESRFAEVLKRVHIDDVALMLETIERMRTHRLERCAIEIRLQAKNGDWRWILSQAKVIEWDASGQALRMIGTHTDITDRKQAEAALKHANARLEDLIARQSIELLSALRDGLKTSEAEQRRIGQEIHDTLCQELVGLLHMTQELVKQLPEHEPAGRDAREMAVHMSRAVRMSRDFSRDLTLIDMEDSSLEDNLYALADRVRVMFGVEVELALQPGAIPPTSDLQVHVFRIVREAVINAAKHAAPTQIWVDMVVRDGRRVMTVSNDGKPLPPLSQTRENLGLRQMRVRARLLNATLAFRARAEGGAMVELVMEE